MYIVDYTKEFTGNQDVIMQSVHFLSVELLLKRASLWLFILNSVLFKEYEKLPIRQREVAIMEISK